MDIKNPFGKSKKEETKIPAPKGKIDEGQEGRSPQDDTSEAPNTLFTGMKTPPSHPTKMDKAKAFAKELEEPPPDRDGGDRPGAASKTEGIRISKGQETPSSHSARMDKAKVFSETLKGHTSKFDIETPSEPKMSIAELMQKTSVTEARDSEHADDKPPEKIDVQQELMSEEREIAQLYSDTAESVSMTIRDLEKGDPVSIELLEIEMSKLSDKLLFGNPKLLTLALQNGRVNRNNSEPFEFHSLNAAIIAMNIGGKLGYNKSRVVELGIATLFHDIGLTKLQDLTSANRKLTKKEFKKIVKHPSYGAKMLKRSLLPGIYIQAVLQHHEREDGSGYPYGLKGQRIHEYAKIAGLADIVQALSQNRPHRPAVPAYEAVKTAVEDWSDSFEPRIVKALVQALGVYPVGTVVELSSKEVGKVIKTPSDSPLRPIIQVFGKNNGEDVRPKIIDLSQNTNIQIKKILNEN